MRRRVKQLSSLEDRLAEFAQKALQEAEALPPGPERDEMQESEESAGCERDERLGQLARTPVAQVSVALGSIASYRARAESCRQEAEQACSNVDKQAWLELARDWTKLADDIERRAENFD
jgi:hypothetical protein